MLLDLSRIRTAHTAVDEVYPPDAFRTADEAYAMAAPARLHIDVYKDGRRFRLAGHLETRLELPCSRCLEPFPWPIDVSFDLQYQPQSTNVGDGEHEVEEDDLSTAYYENEEIDLGQLIREQIYLALPMKPLCRDDCRGLCPVCGINLNRGTCTCTRSWEDSRLAALKTLKKDQ